jgi:hypothetical protein
MIHVYVAIGFALLGLATGLTLLALVVGSIWLMEKLPIISVALGVLVLFGFGYVLGSAVLNTMGWAQ